MSMHSIRFNPSLHRRVIASRFERIIPPICGPDQIQIPHKPQRQIKEVHRPNRGALYRSCEKIWPFLSSLRGWPAWPRLAQKSAFPPTENFPAQSACGSPPARIRVHPRLIGIISGWPSAVIAIPRAPRTLRATASTTGEPPPDHPRLHDIRSGISKINDESEPRDIPRTRSQGS